VAVLWPLPTLDIKLLRLPIVALKHRLGSTLMPNENLRCNPRPCCKRGVKHERSEAMKLKMESDRKGPKRAIKLHFYGRPIGQAIIFCSCVFYLSFSFF